MSNVQTCPPPPEKSGHFQKSKLVVQEEVFNASKTEQYTQEFKDSALKMVTEQGYKISEAARNLGIDEKILSRWKRMT